MGIKNEFDLVSCRSLISLIKLSYFKHISIENLLFQLSL